MVEEKTRDLLEVKRMHQVLINALGYAPKLSPAGTTIRICPRQLAAMPAEGDRPAPLSHRIEVLDERASIPEQELESIFGRFAHSGNTPTGAGGTGPGLPIARELVRRRNRPILAANRPEGGGCFMIELLGTTA